MKRVFVLFALILSVLLIAEEPHFMYDPAISPDGSEVCFVFMGDLWVVPFDGGDAKRLTSTITIESSPIYAPDGKTIVYQSDKDGYSNIYSIPAKGGQSRKICAESVLIADFFADNKNILGMKSEADGKLRFVKININGSRPVEIGGLADFYCSVSPNQDKIIFSRFGYPFREKYEGSKNGDLWEFDIQKKSYEKLTNTPLTERYPVYSYVNKNTIYYSASDGDVFQLYRVDDNDFSNPKKLSSFKTWSSRDISIARNSDRIVFEHFDEIWKYDPETGKTKKINININEDYLDSFSDWSTYSNKATSFSVSPNGKWIAFSYKYDLFAVPEKGGEVKQLTFNQKGIEDIVIMQDNNTIFFSSNVNGAERLFTMKLNEPEKIEEVKWARNKMPENMYCSNDDRLVVTFSYGEHKSELAISDTTYKNFKSLVKGRNIWTNVPMSPDDRYLAYTDVVPGVWKRELYLYDLEEDKEVLLWKFDGYVASIYWGLDGKSLFANRGTEIVRIDLVSKDDFIDETDNWVEVMESLDENEDENKKNDSEIMVELDSEDIRARIHTLVKKTGWNYVVHVENDSILYYINNFNNKNELRSISYYGKNDKKLRSLPSDFDYLDFHTNKSLYYTSYDRLYKSKAKSSKSDPIGYSFKYKYDKYQLNKDIFDQIWHTFGYVFYDKDMHGVDWDEVYKRYSKYLDYAYSQQVLSSIVEEMIGEVNASHTGFYSRSDKQYKTYSKAYGGFVLDYSNQLKKGIKFKKIYKDSKLHKPENIKAGDILLAVDGIEIDKNTNIDELFINKIGEKIKLRIKSDDIVREIAIRGLSYSNEYSMYYDNWVNERREKVDKWSDNRLGYLHIESMNNTSYNKFLQDLFAENYEKEGLIIDVRGNGGGYIHDRLLEVLTKKSYGYSTHRYFDSEKIKTPGNTFEKPKVLLIDEDSFSDAEIFPHIFQELELGKVIGVPTSGSVIGTGHYSFMDGSSMRTPSTGWFKLDGTNMELNGAQPDIYVEMSPEQIIEDDDVQLKKAVDELLEQLK